MRPSIAVVCAFAFLSTACSVEHRPARSDETVMRYDLASKVLNIRCVSATAGHCRVLVESSADRRLIMVAAGDSRDVVGIHQTARTCDLPTIVDEISCSWVPVSDLS
jgi:hypothetical protein